jgi:hypothetical protein
MSSPTTTALVQLQALNPLCSRSPAMPRNTPLMSPSKTALVAASKTQSQALTGKSKDCNVVPWLFLNCAKHKCCVVHALDVLLFVLNMYVVLIW